MTRILSIAAFTLGAAIVLWMGASFMGTNPLAFIVTGVIGIVYVIGFLELMRFQKETDTLANALTQTGDKIADLDHWLSTLSPALHSSVRLRIRGEHVPLPAPMVTPYLVGLLVMLGLLGTFAGMVDTLKGAVSALEGTTELEAIRAGLSAPIKGLSLAFGTSVAGVSASAMLGFISTLSRRQRQLASQSLDSQMNTAFQDFSLAHNREQTFKAMQEQAQSLPVVAQALISVSQQLETVSEKISEQLTSQQNHFHENMKQEYQTLAQSVDQSLQKTINDSHDLLGQHLQTSIDALQPLIHNMANTVSKDIGDTHHRLLQDFSQANEQWLSQQQQQDQERLQQWHSAFDKTAADTQSATEIVTQEYQQQQQQVLEKTQSLLKTTEQLIEQRVSTETQWLDRYEQQAQALTQSITEQLNQLREEEKRRGDHAVTQLNHLNESAAEHLQRLGIGLEKPLTQLIETASETPKAAAEVISQLRAEISNTIERDNQLLLERQEIFAQLSKVANTLENTSSEQSDSLQLLTEESANTLKSVSDLFKQQIEQESARLADATDHFSANTVELASVSDAFNEAVTRFGQSSSDISETLQVVEQSLANSSERSDEQMAYYISQAREIIDHTMLSQQEMMEQLRQLSRTTVSAS